MNIRSLGKLGTRLLYTVVASAIVIIILVIISAISIRAFLNENIKGQQALDHIEESSNHLYRSLIDQETGQRGYSLANDEDFLDPYESGVQEFNHSKTELLKYIVDFPSLSYEAKWFIEKGEYWQNFYGTVFVELSKNGEQISLSLLKNGKEALDEFRNIFSNFNEQIEVERTIVRNKMQNGINNTLFTLVITIIVIIIINLLLNIRTLKSVISPIIQLNSCVKSYTQHDFFKDVPSYKKQDELSELIQNVDIMRNELSNNFNILEAEANIDPLTGLYNRRYLNEYVVKQWELAKKQSRYFSLIIIDIDYYKKFNDTYGHLSGDECLQKVTKSIQEFVKEPTSFAARYGGEEFCVVLLHESEKEAFNLAENIRESVMQLKIKHETSKIHPFLTVSSGVVTLMPEGELQLEKVFSMADKALYESKQNGRNKVTQYI